MIRRLRDDEAGPAGCDLRDPQRQIVSLAPGAGQHQMIDLGWKSRQQALRIDIDDVVEIARVDVERADLAANGLDDARMRMPD